jgi:hypothetical protein
MSWGEWICFIFFVAILFWMFDVEWKETPQQTQPAIQTVIVTVRGCDVIQHIQGDRLIAAHNAADQPKSCKVQGVNP